MAEAAADWIEWTGGECPVTLGALVDVRHADGEEYHAHAARVNDSVRNFAAADWKFTGSDSDIIAYRVVQA